jgi:hypothetical protein
VERAGLSRARPSGSLAARLLAAAAVLAVLGCTATISTQPLPSPGASGSVPATPASSADTGGGLAALPAACHAQGGGVLPDSACTPGATDPAVTQDNVRSTICVSGYTTRVRPPTSYTDPIKRDMLRRYGMSGTASAYELDHLVPLEVGGAPASVRNLWPEARGPHPGSAEKDRMENLLHDRVCSGRTPLADAQRMFEQSWLEAWHQLGG